MNVLELVEKHLSQQTLQEEEERLEHDLESWRECLIKLMKECDSKMIAAKRQGLVHGNRVAHLTFLKQKESLVKRKDRIVEVLRDVKARINESRQNGESNHGRTFMLILEELRGLRSDLRGGVTLTRPEGRPRG